MTRTSLLCAAALAAALSACTVNNNAPADNSADANAATEASGDLTAPPADVANPSNDAAGNANDGGNTTAPPPATNASIPAQYQGRWGMVPADCDPKRDDNKGLIMIDSKTIKFYESRATLKEQRPAIATSFAGLFAYTGEGQEWTKVETLTRTGDKLKRANDEGSYDYTRCR